MSEEDVIIGRDDLAAAAAEVDVVYLDELEEMRSNIEDVHGGELPLVLSQMALVFLVFPLFFFFFFFLFSFFLFSLFSKKEPRLSLPLFLCYRGRRGRRGRRGG